MQTSGCMDASAGMGRHRRGIGIGRPHVPVYLKLGSEFMLPGGGIHPLYAYTMPGISITEAQKLLQVTDQIIKRFRRWTGVLGKRPGKTDQTRHFVHA